MSANATFKLGAMPPTAQIAATQSDLDYANALQDQNQQALGQLRGGWGEAVPRMLAAALLHSQTRDDATKLAGQQWGQYQQLGDAMMANLKANPLGGAPPAAVAAPPSTPGAQSSPQLQIAPDAPLNMPGVAPHPSTAGNPLFDPDVIRAIAGEDGNPAGQRAVASVMMNRAGQSGMSLGDVARAPHQFDGLAARHGLNPGDPLFDRTLANVSPILGGQMQPTTTADHFYAPGMMPTPPGWAQGHSGQDIGGNRFFQLGYHGQGGSPLTAGQPMAPSQAPLLPQGPAPVSATDPTAAPPPLTSPAGAPPAPPQAGGMGGAPGGPAAPPPGAQPPPVQPQGVPTGAGATPGELEMLQRLRSNPTTFPQFMQMAQEIAQRQAAPIKLPDGYYFGPDGQAHSALQFQDLPGAANEINQRGPDGQIHTATRGAFGSIPAGMELGADGALHMIKGGGFTDIQGLPPNVIGQRGPNGEAHYQANPAYGSLPAGTAMGVNGQIGALAQPQMITAGGPSPGGGPGAPQAGGGAKSGLIPIGQLYQKDPTTGEIKTDPRLSNALEVSRQAQEAPEVKEYAQLMNAYRGVTNALQAAGRNNGMLDTSFTDATGRVVNPGRSMTNGSVQLWLSHFGLPAEIQGHLSSIFGNGYITPKTMQDGLSVMSAYAKGAHDNADARLSKARDTLATFGVQDPALTTDSVPAIPRVDWLNGNGGAPGGGSPGGMGGQGGGFSRAQLEAEVARRRAAGLMR